MRDFDVSPLRLAERILERPDWARRCLLVTSGSSGKFEELRTLDPGTGIWRDPEATVLGWLGEIADILESDAYQLAAQHRIDPKNVSGMVRAIRTIKNPKKVDEVCHSFAAALGRLQSLGLAPLIWLCSPADLDAQLRFLGVLNGVVDLHEDRLLTPEEAAPALITLFTPVPYDPDRYPAADWFLSHLSPRELDWWLDIFGYSLRGIAKRLYGCLAPPDAGKTSAINLLRATLGPYVASPTVGALDAKVRHDSSGHTPGMFAWLAPVRITIVDEVKERELSAPLVKDLTGGGWFTARDTYQRKVTKRATGTTFMFANDVTGEQPLPQLRTDDPGIRARYRELPFPVIPKEKQDPKMRDDWPYDLERQAQLLTLLIQRAARNSTEPSDIPQVRDATEARIRKDSGELGFFGARFVRDGSARVVFSDAWAAWCAVNLESTDVAAPGGIRKQEFSRRLNAHVGGLGDTTSLRIGTRKVRGWSGWKLRSVEELKRVANRERAISDLLWGYPDLSVTEYKLLRQSLERLFEHELISLRSQYSNGLELSKVVEEDAEEMRPVYRKAYPDLGEEQCAALHRTYNIESLAFIADSSRPVGAVYEQARNRFRRLENRTWGRESVALLVLNQADWELHLGADAEALVRKAVKLFIDELSRMPPDAAARYDAADMEAAIKELAGLPPRKHADPSEPEQVSQELGSY